MQRVSVALQKGNARMIHHWQAVTFFAAAAQAELPAVVQLDSKDSGSLSDSESSCCQWSSGGSGGGCAVEVGHLAKFFSVIGFFIENHRHSLTS